MLEVISVPSLEKEPVPGFTAQRRRKTEQDCRHNGTEELDFIPFIKDQLCRVIKDLFGLSVFLSVCEERLYSGRVCEIAGETCPLHREASQAASSYLIFTLCCCSAFSVCKDLQGGLGSFSL